MKRRARWRIDWLLVSAVLVLAASLLAVALGARLELFGAISGIRIVFSAVIAFILAFVAREGFREVRTCMRQRGRAAAAFQVFVYGAGMAMCLFLEYLVWTRIK